LVTQKKLLILPKYVLLSEAFIKTTISLQ